MEVSGAVIERTANAETKRMMKVMTASVQSVCVSTRLPVPPNGVTSNRSVWSGSTFT